MVFSEYFLEVKSLKKMLKKIGCTGESIRAFEMTKRSRRTATVMDHKVIEASNEEEESKLEVT